MDQADTLRHLLKKPALHLVPVIGDVGRPDASHLAAALVEDHVAEGDRGLVVDASRDVLVEAFGLKKRYELTHYLNGDVPSQAVVLHWSERCALLPATRGLFQLGAAQRMHRQRFAALLQQQCEAGDGVYVAMAHPQAALALSLCADAPEWVWLVEPSRASVTECYKAMAQIGPGCGTIRHRVLVSRAQRVSQADDVFAELEHATRRFFSQPLEYAGQYRGPSCARRLRVRNRLEAII